MCVSGDEIFIDDVVADVIGTGNLNPRCTFRQDFSKIDEIPVVA